MILPSRHSTVWLVVAGAPLRVLHEGQRLWRKFRRLRLQRAGAKQADKRRRQHGPRTDAVRLQLHRKSSDGPRHQHTPLDVVTGWSRQCGDTIARNPAAGSGIAASMPFKTRPYAECGSAAQAQSYQLASGPRHAQAPGSGAWPYRHLDGYIFISTSGNACLTPATTAGAP
jgi:hypothetical protein